MRSAQAFLGVLLTIVALVGAHAFSGCSDPSTSSKVVGADAGLDTGSGGDAVKDAVDRRDTSVRPPDVPSKPDVAVENERFGRGCEEHADCAGGWCIEGPDGLVCTVECVDSCPEG